MSTSPVIDPEVQADFPVSARLPNRPLVVCLPSTDAEAASGVLGQLASTFPLDQLVVASPYQEVAQPAAAGLPAMVPYVQPRGDGRWVLTADDYAAAARLCTQLEATGVILLGNDPGSLSQAGLHALGAALAGGADLALPRYATAPDEALVNSALLYPVNRALFALDAHFPLPLDAGLSPRMAARLLESGGKPNLQNESGLLWPVAEAALAGFTLREIETGPRSLPHPQEADLNDLFPAVTSSLFADMENKAAYWQRARAVAASRPAPTTSRPLEAQLPVSGEVRSLVDSFRSAFDNLREIWSLVLPPQSLLAHKKLANSTPESFVYPPNLWARTIYDFCLAFHLRTLNRGHLLGSLTPLYLAWVASFLQGTENSPDGGRRLLEATALAFEQEKPYLVSRWRWPDRFNP